ncbi:hypothetical protein [Compostibacter hankyongensis]|uniref:Glycoside hydrolase family 42 N-terminal domain-containing protein n=1 Tax=Compostibacter hankyongensis TaxID=1007089 RepID=A0ABP8FZ86_9BACT
MRLPSTIPCIILLWLVSAPVLPLTAKAAGRCDSLPVEKRLHSPLSDTAFFPIAVWLQDPSLAPRYKKAGINTYIGLWQGPTEAQLDILREAGMKLICEQNAVGLRHLGDTLIIGWMHGDEPDNAQPLGKGKGYGPPVTPAEIFRRYRRLKAKDPSRPVLLNLGQGVAWDDWVGRGVRRNHPEDYPQYMQGGDIISFDIYPVAHPDTAISGKLWYVAKGVQRLVKWGQGKKPVWNCLECTHIGEPDKKATPRQVRAEAWMSLIHGSTGLIWFVHEFRPAFNASALLDDPQMLAAVTSVNRQITELAAVLHRPSLSDHAAAQTAVPGMQVDMMAKQYGNSLYLFSVGMRKLGGSAAFHIKGLPQRTTVTVIDEGRTLEARNGIFTDTFKPWDVHIYRIDYPGQR